MSASKTLYSIDKGFRKFERWQAAATKHGAKLKRASKTAKNEYWQAIIPGVGIVGFFNTGLNNGNLTILAVK